MLLTFIILHLDFRAVSKCMKVTSRNTCKISSCKDLYLYKYESLFKSIKDNK